MNCSGAWALCCWLPWTSCSWRGPAHVLLSAFLILFSGQLYAAIRPYHTLSWLGAQQEEPGPEDDGLLDHVLVVGMNTLGRCLVDRLVEAGETVVAVDTDAEKLAPLAIPTVHSDAVHETVREKMHLDTAKLLVSSLSIERTNNLLAYQARQAGVPCSIPAFDRTSEDSLRDVGIDFLIRSKHEEARFLLHELQLRGEPHHTDTLLFNRVGQSRVEA